MNDTYRRIAPVLASIAIIIVIAVLRDRSKALAAITATMPINVALGLWLVYVADGTDQATVISFTRSMFAGVVATLIWLVAVWLGARAGWGLGRLLLVGYAAWGLAIGVVFAVQSLLGGPPAFPR
jgi:hypothetical protein